MPIESFPGDIDSMTVHGTGTDSRTYAEDGVNSPLPLHSASLSIFTAPEGSMSRNFWAAGQNFLSLFTTPVTRALTFQMKIISWQHLSTPIVYAISTFI